jgi:asparagine synthase (glutamine-hydrolysing)
VFRTASDTEVVLRAYEAWGEACVDRFNGQYAFAVWNGRRSELFLARDRLGIAPLHYAIVDGAFVFASEAKALLEYPGAHPSIDPEGVAEALLCGTLFDGRTMFRGMLALPPGCWARVSAEGVVVTQCYWDVPLSHGPGERYDESGYAERMLPLLDEALRMRLSPEVPWGVMLSGGTDSSTLATLAAAAASAPVRTFTIDFPNRWKGANLDAHYARLVAGALKTDHYEFLTEPEDYYQTLERVTWHIERPFNKGASTMFLLYKQIKAHATVVITGEGADELFAGYVGERGLGLDEVLANGTITGFPWAAYAGITARLFSEDFAAAVRPDDLFHERLARAVPRNGSDPLNAALYLYTKYFLLELLELHDRTSLAFGVEARLPFLDHRFVELLSPMPSKLKVRDGHTKYLFKQVVKHLLPEEILTRRKTPMPIPRDPETLRRQTRLTRELVCASDARTRAYFDGSRVLDFLERRGEFEHVDALCVWKVSMYLLTLELLHRVFRL